MTDHENPINKLKVAKPKTGLLITFLVLIRLSISNTLLILQFRAYKNTVKKIGLIALNC
jgi:hypothetical protein